MVKWLRSCDADFSTQLDAVIAARQGQQDSVQDTVKSIINRIRNGKDAALCELTTQFDRLPMTPQRLRISEAEWTEGAAACSPDIVAALAFAANRVRDFHERQKPADYRFTDADGTMLGWRWTAIDAVGLYVPGGKASYPSSVLMNAIPAKVAGCARLAMMVPTPDNQLNPAVLVAAQLAGVDEIYRIGGAQAVSALSFGTETIKPVDKIVGPGNAYVAEAKRQLFGTVGIDTIAGPSEILLVADDRNDPAWMAADLLSQAEHDTLAQSILICDSESFAKRVLQAVDACLVTLPRRAIAEASWHDYGVVILVDHLADAAPIINRIAPEHLELAIENPEELAELVRHAGAIFMGRYTPEAIGDYLAGPSHVLPTNRAARFASGLSVYDFMKKSTLIRCTQDSVQPLAAQAERLARCEGLDAHALSAALRLKH